MTTVKDVLGIILIVFLVSGWPVWILYRRRSRSAQVGFKPGDISAVGPWMRVWRLHRADHGKSDNWLTRPIIGGRNGRIEFFPEPGKPDKKLDK
jgi:hypothetical protein